jgi:bifunctional DNA-binding transcriptional regulator/antitoxin component of YhaV-PrlF toxin-antitoxin module
LGEGLPQDFRKIPLFHPQRIPAILPVHHHHLSMTTVVGSKTPILIPEAIRRRAGIVAGDRAEIKAIRGVITMVSKPKAADDEYTPEQRRLIDARLRAADKGPFYGPFKNGSEISAFLRAIKAKRPSRSKPLR